jgi:hypothetical protein
MGAKSLRPDHPPPQSLRGGALLGSSSSANRGATGLASRLHLLLVERRVGEGHDEHNLVRAH